MVYLVGVLAVVALWCCAELGRQLQSVRHRLRALERADFERRGSPSATVAAIGEVVAARTHPQPGQASPESATTSDAVARRHLHRAGATVPASPEEEAAAEADVVWVEGEKADRAQAAHGLAPLPDAPAPPWMQPEPAPRATLAPPRPVAGESDAGASVPTTSRDWERWLGVRGAAVLGGIALALASIFLFRYAVEHGHLTPGMRLTLGSSAGVLCLLGSTLLLRRGYAWVAHALAGAALVAFCAVTWAARELYGFIDMPVAIVAMVATTVLACVLAHRRASMFLAALALLGGFATPLLVRGSADEPIGLFGYLLLLDAALLILLRRHRWPWLGAVSLLASAAFQAHWIGTRMPPTHLGLGLGVLLAFAMLFAVGARNLLTRAAALFLPFAFALHLGLRADLGPHLWPVVVMLVILVSALVWLGRRAGQPLFGVAASAAALGVCAPWLGRVPMDTPIAWEAALSLVALAVPGVAMRQGGGVLVSTLGGMVLLAPASARAGAVSPWPWWGGAVALAALACGVGGVRPRAWAQTASAGLLGLVLATHAHAHAGEATAVSQRLLAPLGLALAVVVVALGATRREVKVRRWAEAGAWVLPLLLALVLRQRVVAVDLGVWSFHALVVAFAAVAAVAASRFGSAVGLALAAALAAFVQMHWPRDLDAHLAVWLQLASLAVFCLWPVAWSGPFLAQRGAWRAAALVPPLFWPTAFWHALPVWGAVAFERLAFAVGSVLGLAAWRARGLWPQAEPVRTSALAWLGGFAVLAWAAAVPQPDIPHAWMPRLALQMLFVAVLWAGVDHLGLKVVALACALGVMAGAITHPLVTSAVPLPTSLLFNGVNYAYAVAAVAMLAVAQVFGRLEVARLRRLEAQPIAAVLTGLYAVGIVFVWLNVGVALAFAEGDSVAISFVRHPARDLTTSVVWIVYALVLLVIGVGRQSTALRWVSLVLILLSVGKVFLHDLGELTDLYRVASLAGLALSLLAISVLYQRFVFDVGQRPSRDPGA
ncbi:MAG: DUF2339 domain-containing protein [Planctomycetota bacterium]